MNDLKDSLVALAERGNPRGGDAVFDAAVSTRRIGLVDEDSRSNEVDLVAVAPSRPRRRKVALLAAAILVLGGVGTAKILDRDHSTTDVSSPWPSGPDLWGAFPAPRLTARFQFLSVATDSGLLVWGGYDASSQSLTDGAYWDGPTQTWTTLPPAPLDQTRGDAIGVWTGNEVVVLNGVDGVTAAAFDPATFTWRRLPAPSNVPAANNAATRLYLIDGNVVFVHILNDDQAGDGVDLLDLATSTWRASTGVPTMFVGASVRFTASSDALYALVAPTNGADCDGRTRGVFSYDVNDDTWISVATDTPFSNWYPAIFGWAGDRLVLAGGVDCSSGEVVSYATSLDPFGAWTAMMPAPTDLRIAGAGRYADAIWTGTRLVSTLADGRAISYHPGADFWHIGPSFLRPGDRFDETPAAWVNGQLVVVSPGYRFDESQGGWSCCHPEGEAFAYTPPLFPAAAALGVPGMATSIASESTADSEAFAALVASVTVQAGWPDELREHATRTAPDGAVVQWAHLADNADRRLFVISGPSGQLDSFAGRAALRGSRNAADDSILVWPEEPGATTVAIDTGDATVIVRSEAVQVATGMARPEAEVVALAESIALTVD